jgi:microcystin-dependent protein
MAEPFLGELRLMSFNFPPKSWAQCNGQLLSIAQNQALFSLLGTQYGGNGQTTFALPDLRGRVAIHRGGLGGTFTQGEVTGEETHTITANEMPQHTHRVQASSSNADQAVPTILASSPNFYGPPSSLTTIEPTTLANTGGSQPHENRPPFLVLEWCIALTGIFPSVN